VTCVDLDIFASNRALYASFQMYTRAGEVTRLPSGSALHQIAEPAETALLFCFGKRVPWAAYVSKYGGALPAIIVIGDEREGETAITEPTAFALRAADTEAKEGWPWRVAYDGPCRAVMAARLVVYENERAPAVQAALSLAGGRG
jgi:hypothetical protein